MIAAKTALAERQSLFQNKLDAHRKIIFKVVAAFTWQREDQQDLAQEITFQLWRAFANYDGNRLFSTWMYQVALNTAISWSRKHKLRQHVSDEALEDMPAPEASDSDSESLYALIDQLDELNRALLLLYIDEHSHVEIGEILGISPSNVATKINRLKIRLRLQAEGME